jgi:hypothetical protein
MDEAQDLSKPIKTLHGCARTPIDRQRRSKVPGQFLKCATPYGPITNTYDSFRYLVNLTIILMCLEAFLNFKTSSAYT